MATKCYLLTTEKKRNSTAIVDHTKSTWVYDCETVEPFSITHPTVKFWFGANPATGESYNPTISINYAYIPAFGRYYWINSWTYDSGMWYADMSVDPLATYRDAILNNTQFVERSKSQTMGLTDALPATTVKPTFQTVSMTTETKYGTSFNTALGCYVVGIVNSDTNSVGCTSYYMFKLDGFRAFCNKLLDNINWASAGIDEISAPLLKALFNPMQYITSCVWFPFCPYEATAFENITLPFGWWSFTAKAIKLQTFEQVIRFEGTVPKHPNTSTYGTFINYAPYTRATLHWGVLGDIPLDTSFFDSNGTTIRLRLTVDYVTGKAMYCIYKYQTASPSIQYMQTGPCQIGVNVSVAQSSFDIFGVTRSAVAVANGAATAAVGAAKIGATAGIAALTGASNDVISGTTTIANGLIDGLQSVMPQISTNGQNGSTIGFWEPPSITVQYYVPFGVSPATDGYLTMAPRQLSELVGGFVKCRNAHYTGLGFTDEVATIDACLNNGLFLE